MVCLFLYLPLVCYNIFFFVKSTPETTNYSDKTLSLLWSQSGYPKKSGKDPGTLSKAISRVGLVESCICMNRVGVPMGNSGDMSVSDIRFNLISLFVTGLIPRNCSLANIVISIQRPDSDVAFEKPLYIGVKEKDTLAVASSPHNRITRCNFVSPGKKILKAFQ